MNNSKRFLFVSFSILLIVALFIAMICSYFLPFGDKEVFAEVSSLTINTPYYFEDLSSSFIYSSIYTLPTSFTNYTGSCSMVWSFGGVDYSCSSVNLACDISQNNRVIFSFFNNSSPSNYFQLYFTKASNSRTLTFSHYYCLGSSHYDSDYVNYTFTFSSLPNFSSQPSWVGNFVSELLLYYFSVVVTDSTPVLTSSIIDNSIWFDSRYSYEDPNNSGYIWIEDFGVTDYNLHLYGYSIDNADDYSFLLSGTDCCKIHFTGTVYNTVANISNTFNGDYFIFKSDDDNYYISFRFPTYDLIDLGVPSSRWIFAVTSFSFCFCDPDNDFAPLTDYYYDFVADDYELSALNFNNTVPYYSDTYYNYNVQTSYQSGYADGIEADKTLLSVMWQTFNLPFRLLFGTYDENPNSSTYNTYVGGLFNFTLLGVDMRGFCIGIMSFAIVLAIIRLIIGVKGS